MTAPATTGPATADQPPTRGTCTHCGRPDLFCVCGSRLHTTKDVS